MQYLVFAEHMDRRQFLGAVEGLDEDIKAYFVSQQAYRLILEPLKIIKINAGYKLKRDELIRRKNELEMQIRDIDSQLRKF